MSRRLRVLVSAYACEPGRGSDPGVGWNQVAQIARFQDVWVITRKSNAEVIRLHAGSLPGVHWVFHDLPRWARFWKKGGRGVHVYYYMWQIGAWRAARRLHRKIRFDLAHHVTFVTYWMPSFMALLPIPFIWGPVGGGESAPRGFWKTFSARGKVSEMARVAARWLGEHDPAVRACARRSRLALATTRETAARLVRIGCRDVRLLGESGIGAEDLDSLGAFPPGAGGAPRLMSVGRLVYWKGYHLGMQAFARVRDKFPGCTYVMVGRGPERARLEALARRLGVLPDVRFKGTVSRAEVLRQLGECDIFVHPSLHDSGGWACLEAMSAGRPVICMDMGGPAVQVSADTGIRVRASNGEAAVAGLASAMELLMADGQLRRGMGKTARGRVASHFSWNGKGELIRGLYARVISEV